MSEMVAENVQVRERFVCDNDMKAEWCLNKIRKARAEYNREAEELDRQMQFYMDQKDMLKRKADEEVSFFEEILRGYFQSRVDEGFTKETKTKVSYKLPTGTLVLKHREPEYDRDDAKLIEWMSEQDESKHFIKVKESVDWAEMKKHLKFQQDGTAVDEDGLIVPGVKAIVREDEFEVEVK